MQDAWKAARPPFPLTATEAHVWLARLDDLPDVTTHLTRLLSEEEREKAARFHFERDRVRYSLAHAFLRQVLGAYLGADPRALAFAAASHGKPYLIRQPALPDVRFNLSHSHDAALLALTLDREIGVDVEFARPLEDADLIATQFFSRSERAALQSLPPGQKNDAFFRCWSRKEAVIKGLGLGLAMPLNDFDVSLAPGDPAQLIALRGDASASGPWTLHDLPPIVGYASALVAAGSLNRISCHRWMMQDDAR